MSDKILLCVLRMPMPDDPKEMSEQEWIQFKAITRDAADRIESDNKRFDDIGVFLKKWTALIRNEATEILYKHCC